MARIQSIVRKKIDAEKLYNLAVEQDESFVADGIVVHNCKSYLVPNLVGKTNKEIDPTGLTPSSPDLEKYITLTEPTQYADNSGDIQTFVISKYKAKSVAEAKALVKKFGGKPGKVEETENSYRFRQAPPGDFIEGQYRTFQPVAGVSLVYGKRKQ